MSQAYDGYYPLGDDSALPSITSLYVAPYRQQKFMEADMIELPSMNEVMVHTYEWTQAFIWYNRHHSKKMGMMCIPCYHKVYFALKEAKQIHDKSRSSKKA